MPNEEPAWDRSKADEAWGRYMSKAAQAVPPITRDLLDALGFDPPTQEQLDAIGDALGRAYLVGVDAGETEALAQAIEQGAKVTIQRPPPEPPED